MLTSIMNFQERGIWGNSRYRGNCSGFVIKNLLDHFKPKKFMEIFAGGGTGYDVAKDLGYENSIHLDLNPHWGGHNVLKDDIPEGTDFTFLHPPYHDIIQYSGEMWGEAHPDDLSRCPSYDDFISKLDKVHAKVYASLRNGGRMAILVGDCRRNGDYFSIMMDMAKIGKLESHIIKIQNNCVSDRTSYKGKFIPILHEHLLVFRKNDVWAIPLAMTKKTTIDMKNSDTPTWRDLLQATMESHPSNEINLSDLYALIGTTRKASKNPHWKEKIRQTLQLHDEFEPVERGIWRLRKLDKSVAA